MSRWKKGVISQTLKSHGGSIIPKGTPVEYKRIQTQPDADGRRYTLYEWHYKGNNTYIRSMKRTIEGLEVITEPYI